MAHEYKYKNRRVLHSWWACGILLVKHIRNLKYGRPDDGTYKKWKLLMEMIDLYDRQAPVKQSPFILTVNGSVLTFNQSALGITSASLENDPYPYMSNCLSAAQIDALEDRIIEITKHCRNA